MTKGKERKYEVISKIRYTNTLIESTKIHMLSLYWFLDTFHTYFLSLSKMKRRDNAHQQRLVGIEQ